jgi:pimeloyl-ACP methyl ester carboxylesterase
MVAVGTSELECFSHGAGAAIILLPGGSLAVGYLADLAEVLSSSGFRAIRVNPRGAGASTGRMDGLTLHDYADDVAGVITALGVAPAAVLGHAFGNRVARMVAADHPGLVSSVILIAAGGKVEPRPEAQQALRTLFTPSASAAEIADAMTWMVGSPDNAARVWARFKDDRAPGAAHGEAVAAAATSLEEWWAPPGEVPYLVIQGLSDEVAPVENGHLLARELDGRVTVVDVPGAGHLQPLEAPGPVAAAVIEFLT